MGYFFFDLLLLVLDLDLRAEVFLVVFLLLFELLDFDDLDLVDFFLLLDDFFLEEAGSSMSSLLMESSPTTPKITKMTGQSRNREGGKIPVVAMKASTPAVIKVTGNISGDCIDLLLFFV